MAKPQGEVAGDDAAERDDADPRGLEAHAEHEPCQRRSGRARHAPHQALHGVVPAAQVIRRQVLTSDGAIGDHIVSPMAKIAVDTQIAIPAAIAGSDCVMPRTTHDAAHSRATSTST